MSELDRIEIGHLRRGICVLKEKLKAEKNRNQALKDNLRGCERKIAGLQERLKRMKGEECTQQ